MQSLVEFSEGTGEDKVPLVNVCTPWVAYCQCIHITKSSRCANDFFGVLVFDPTFGFSFFVFWFYTIQFLPSNCGFTFDWPSHLERWDQSIVTLELSLWFYLYPLCSLFSWVHHDVTFSGNSTLNLLPMRYDCDSIIIPRFIEF